jgi:D-alanine-D-alanine ligase
MTHVQVLAGGLSPERDVSLRSGRRVAEALRTLGVEVSEVDVNADLIPHLQKTKPDCVIPLLHGAAGEDGAVRQVLQALGIPFVGSLGSACELAFDKTIAKTLLAAAGVRTPHARALPQSTFRELGASAVLEALVADIGLPLVVKPTKGGSALGVTVVRTADAVPAAMVAAFAYGDVVLIEQHITGMEVALSVLQDPQVHVLPAFEIVPPDGFYDYSARYVAGVTEFFVPARCTTDALQAAQDIAVRAHTVLGLRDWSRTDVIIDDAGVPWFLEVNVAPGMTETSLFPQSIAAAGEALGDVLVHLVDQALTR